MESCTSVWIIFWLIHISIISVNSACQYFLLTAVCVCSTGAINMTRIVRVIEVKVDFQCCIINYIGSEPPRVRAIPDICGIYTCLEGNCVPTSMQTSTTTHVPVTVLPTMPVTSSPNIDRHDTVTGFVIWGVICTLLSLCLLVCLIYHRKRHAYMSIPKGSPSMSTEMTHVINPEYTPSPSPHVPLPPLPFDDVTPQIQQEENIISEENEEPVARRTRSQVKKNFLKKILFGLLAVVLSVLIRELRNNARNFINQLQHEHIDHPQPQRMHIEPEPQPIHVEPEPQPIHVEPEPQPIHVEPEPPPQLQQLRRSPRKKRMSVD